MDQNGDNHQLIVSSVHFCLVVCDWIRWHPKAGAAACNRFVDNAFGTDGHANVDIALRTGMAAVHDMSEIGEHGYFKKTQMDVYIREVLHLRGERPN